MNIIITDTETTGLLLARPTDMKLQPFITDIYAMKIDENFNMIEQYETLVRPPIPISKEITKITGITDELLIGAPTFLEIYSDLYDFFKDGDLLVGQNISYDVGVIAYELMRHGLEHKSSWPKHSACTIEASYHYQNKRLALSKLHEFLFGEGFENAHRAKPDVRATARCFVELCKRGDIDLSSYK